MKRSFSLLGILGLAICIVRCTSLNPGGFWHNFKKKFVVSKSENQGLRGGFMSIHWRSASIDEFRSDYMIKFAGDNGWQLVDSTHFSKNETNKWIFNSKPIFPLSFQGFNSRPLIYDANYEKFPLQIGSGVYVYSFKTGWIMIEPGTDLSKDVNGFIVIDDLGQQMYVYFLWGE